MWVKLPADMLGMVAGLMDCPLDTKSMSKVSTDWQQSLSEWAMKRRCPMLLFCKPSADNLLAGTLCCVPASQEHQICLPIQLAHARLFGSFPGGWLFAATDRSNSHFLFKTIISVVIDLLSIMAWQGGRPGRMVMRAATW